MIPPVQDDERRKLLRFVLHVDAQLEIIKRLTVRCEGDPWRNLQRQEAYTTIRKAIAVLLNVV